MPPGTSDTIDQPWVLAIEASNPSAGEGDESGTASVAGARLEGGMPGAVTEARFTAASRKEDGLLPAIERVRESLDVPAGALRRVCVSVGPGGYTGLRVSVTVAKTLAFAAGAEAVAVPSASVAPGDGRPERPFGVCLASKGAHAHLTVFEDPSALVGEAVGVISAEDVRASLLDRGVSFLIADRYLPEPIRFAFEEAGGAVLAPRFSAARCLTVGCVLPPTDPFGLVPVYAREPEAVRLWRERRSSGS